MSTFIKFFNENKKTKETLENQKKEYLKEVALLLAALKIEIKSTLRTSTYITRILHEHVTMLTEGKEKNIKMDTLIDGAFNTERLEFQIGEVVFSLEEGVTLETLQKEVKEMTLPKGVHLEVSQHYPAETCGKLQLFLPGVRKVVPEQY